MTADEGRNYLLDYKESGDLGPLKIITINYAVDAEEYEAAIEWLRRKILANDREFTLNEPAPLILTADPERLKGLERQGELTGVVRDDDSGIIITGMRERP